MFVQPSYSMADMSFGRKRQPNRKNPELNTRFAALQFNSRRATPLLDWQIIHCERS